MDAGPSWCAPGKTVGLQATVLVVAPLRTSLSHNLLVVRAAVQDAVERGE